MADVTLAVAKSHQKAPHQTGHSRVLHSIAKFAGVLKYDPTQPRGPKGSPEGGRWVKGAGGTEHWVGEGTPTEPVVGRTFTSEEGYQWHEQGPVAEWAKQLPYKAWRALDDYRSFGYHSINDQLRGKLEPKLEPETLRPATPEEVAKAKEFSMTDDYFKQFGMTAEEYIKKFGYSTVMSGKPGPPDDPYHRLLDEQGNYVGHVVHTPYTTMDDPANFTIQRLAPNYKPLHEAMQQAHEIDTLIREQGYELPEAIQVERGAYIPGLAMHDLQKMVDEGTVWEEKGFTSTMVGDAGGRATSYPVLAKDESLYNRYHDKMFEHADETGAAIRFHITLPKGTKVASVEALRRLDYEFPRKPITDPRPENIAAEYWTEPDYSRTPTVKTKRLEETNQRSESEVVLGSGAQFRVMQVRRGKTHVRGVGVPDTDIIDVNLEYTGGGSSERRH